MDRINTTSAVPDGNGPGKAGFRDGNLAGGIVPTSLNAAWFNQMQEEIANTIEAVGLTLDGTSQTQLLEAILLLTGPGRLLGVRTITASGTYIPTAGTARFIVEGVAPGGGSGGNPNPAGAPVDSSLSAPGSSGAYAKALFEVSAPSYAVVIGAVGNAGSGSGSGGAGGTSTFGALMSLPGGNGGSAGTGAPNAGIMQPAPPTGLPTVTGAISVIGSMKGASGTAGIQTGPNNGAAGMGGSNPLGFGGAGGAAQTGAAYGSAGNGYGSGAGGAYSTYNGGASAGGAGAPGVFVVYEYS